MVVSNIFYFHPILGEMIQFHSYFFKGVGNHQPEDVVQAKKHPGCVGYFCGDEILSTVLW